MSFFDFIQSASSSSSYDMAIDLGTANTLVGISGQGVVINEPSVVAIERSTHRVLAVGHEAKNMINHTPDTFSAEHPLHDGVVSDYDITEAMISAFINKAAPRRYPWQPKPRIVVCIPCGATSVEKRAVFEATIQAGARQAYLIEEPMAAAMGADLPVTEPTGSVSSISAVAPPKWQSSRSAASLHPLRFVWQAIASMKLSLCICAISWASRSVSVRQRSSRSR